MVFIQKYILVLFMFRDKFRDGYESIKKAFRKMDKNMDGSVSKEEFLQVLEYFHYYINEIELEKLMARLVRNTVESL